jgi:transcriptional regulator
MPLHPWDAATGPAEWQDWLATTDRSGILAVNNPRPGPAPADAALHFTVADEELLMHLAGEHRLSFRPAQVHGL